MKTTNVLLAFFAYSVSGAVVDRRQSGSLGKMNGVPMKPNSVVDASPQLRSNAKRSIARWGPFELPAPKVASSTSHSPPAIPDLDKPMDPNGFVITKTLSGGLCEDCTVLVGTGKITYEDGSEAGIENGVYLHHMLTMDMQKPSRNFVSMCPGNQTARIPGLFNMTMPSRFLGGGPEHFATWFTTTDGKFDSGFHAGKGPYVMSAEIVNYKSTQQTVYITFDHEYVPGIVGRDAFQSMLTVTGCAAPPGYFSDTAQNTRTSEPFLILEDAELINSRGHLHDGGESIILYLNDRPICTSVATYGDLSKSSMAGNGDKKWEGISKMSECSDPILVKKGDFLKMESIYDLAKHPLRDSHGEKMEEMGVFTFTFVSKPGRST